MKNFIKDNWFKILVIVLLIMIHTRLEEIKDNTFYTADMVDASSSRIINAINSGF